MLAVRMRFGYITYRLVGWFFCFGLDQHQFPALQMSVLLDATDVTNFTDNCSKSSLLGFLFLALVVSIFGRPSFVTAYRLSSVVVCDVLYCGLYDRQAADVCTYQGIFGALTLCPCVLTLLNQCASGGATLWQSSANALPVCCHALPIALPVF